MQDDVIDAIRGAVEARLLAANSSRTYAAAPVHERLTLHAAAGPAATQAAQLGQTQTQLPFTPLNGTQGGLLGRMPLSGTGGGLPKAGSSAGRGGTQAEGGEDGADEDNVGDEGVAGMAATQSGRWQPGAVAGAQAGRPGPTPAPYRPDKLVRTDHR